MTFIQRLGISLSLSSLLGLLVIDHSRPYAEGLQLLVTYLNGWLFLIPISVYSSSTIPVQLDTHGTPVPVLLRAAKLRAVIGLWIMGPSIAVAVVFFLSATYEFAGKYEWIVLGPIIAILPVGAYLSLPNMCPYCGRLNAPHLLTCEKCGNSLPAHWTGAKRVR